MLTDATIRELLRHCYDPELSLNLVDLGVVQNVRVALAPDAPGAGIPGVPPRHQVRVELLATNPDETAQAQLRAQIENLLAGTPEIVRTTVIFLDEPVWSPTLLSTAGRRALKLEQPVDPPAFFILNNRQR